MNNKETGSREKGKKEVQAFAVRERLQTRVYARSKGEMPGGEMRKDREEG